MKNSLIKFAAIYLAALCFLFSCHPQSSARFENPQPQGSDNLSEFPSKLLGTYSNDMTMLVVEPNKVLSKYDYDLVEQKDSMKKYFDIENDIITDKNTGEKFKSTLKGDSVYWHYSSKFDTIFSIQNGGVLRKFKGYYFLNNPVDSSYWEVKKLNMSGNQLTLGQIIDSTDLANLKTVTETQSDSTNKFNPSRKQFRKYLRNDGFSSETIFYRKKD